MFKFLKKKSKHDQPIDQLLIDLKACKEAREWAKGKSWQTIYDTCPRGDWLIWLFNKTNPNDLQLLTLAKGHCVNTVRHLMKDERSITAVDMAIAFGSGKCTLEDLENSKKSAAAAYDDAAVAYAAAAYDNAAAAYDDAAVAYDDAAVAYDDAAVAYAAAAYDNAAAVYAAAVYAAAAKIKNQKETADICRKYISIEKYNI